jgi:ABC-type metal ion transport system substrate-binding protein
MADANKTIVLIKENKTISVIVGVVLVAFGVQWARFYSQVSKLENGSAVSLPNNYWPFNNTYMRGVDGKVKKA